MEEIEVCTKSGDLPSVDCEETSIEMFPKNCVRAKQCIYHKQIHLNYDSTYKVNSECYDVSNMRHVSWFTLPPMMAYYYQKVNPYYEVEPDLHPDCMNGIENNMQMIYPKDGSKLFLPRNLDGTKNQIVFKLAHTKSDELVYWHLDGNFMGTTKETHNRVMFTNIGNHKLTVVDTDGNEVIIEFEIIDING